MIALLMFRLQPAFEDSKSLAFLKEFVCFGFKEALSSIFPAFIFSMLILSHFVHIPFISRYDFLLLACIGMQAIMYFTGMETRDELIVITMFHLIGLMMEIFKVHMGSWEYPEPSYSKFYGVPLYSGFMYASVGSYVCQAWRWFHLKMDNWPGAVLAIAVSLIIYANFFSHHYIYDLRWVITILLITVFWRTKVSFTTNTNVRRIPLVLAFFLIGFFIWLAENIATFFGAWKYASQHHGWKMVGYEKISSWFLLVVLSIVIVSQLRFIKDKTHVTT